MRIKKLLNQFNKLKADKKLMLCVELALEAEKLDPDLDCTGVIVAIDKILQRRLAALKKEGFIHERGI